MKKLMFVLLILCSFNSYSQKLKEYKASNGITYHVGDSVVMGAASGDNDYYVYMWMTSALAKGQGIRGRAYIDTPVIIKKIKNFKVRGEEKVMFLVGGGNITNYTLDIENAISACEIKDCNNKKPTSNSMTSKYDELKKLKELLDSGVITQEEFEKEKEKILNQK